MRFGPWDESGLLIHARQIRDASRAPSSVVMSEDNVMGCSGGAKHG